jgi:hypothetical protein
MLAKGGTTIMYRSFLFRAVLFLYVLPVLSFAGDAPTIRNPSPNGRFALRIAESKEESEPPTVELIEKESGKVMVDLGTSYLSNRNDIVLVWSADSKRVAYATRGFKEGDVSVYFWTGTKFELVEMPKTLPNPDIKFARGAGGEVKNYGGAPKPLRWLKSGELLMSNDAVMLSRVDGKTYSGIITFTLAFDKNRHATVRNISKTKTTVD